MTTKLPAFRSAFALCALALSALVGAAAAAHADPLIIAPASGARGEPISVAAYEPGGVTAARAQLATTAGRTLVESEAFPVPLGAQGSAWVALLGIPSELQPGGYTLRVVVDGADGTSTRDLALDVTKRAFPYEQIRLNGTLSEMREKPDPLKDAQARELWGILTTFTPADLYQLGPFRAPLPSWIVTSPFGERRTFAYTDGVSPLSIHDGVDMAAPAGTPVTAAGKGRVVFAGSFILTGNTVVIEHLPGVYSLYFHMSELEVKEGQLVDEGQPLGKVGETGLATGPHLHWEVCVGGVSISPLDLIGHSLVDKDAIIDRIRGNTP